MRTAWTLLGRSIKGQCINRSVVRCAWNEEIVREIHIPHRKIMVVLDWNRGKFMLRKYIDNMISQLANSWHYILVQIRLFLAFYAARYCKQFTHRPCPVSQWSRLLTALQNDDLRRAVQLSLTGCCNLARMADKFWKKRCHVLHVGSCW